jgi:two-component system, OmpR family, copper resistance phosphate regulon response regulator CusR
MWPDRLPLRVLNVLEWVYRTGQRQRESSSMGIRLLIVEDEAKIAKFLVQGLREEGYTVEHAASGNEAWQSLRAGHWDLVLLDWWLPDQDGLTLLQRFRQADRRTPVLFLTARDAVSDRVRGLDAGADDYLSKPFSFDELLARIRALIRRRESVDGTMLAYGDIRVDLASGRAERDGHALDLTAKEQALLVFFLRFPGQVLTRARIYENVWDERYDGISNTLEVHVKELRRKLETRGPRLIQTLRNRGYLLGEPPEATGEHV